MPPAFRSLIRTPAFTLGAILTLALGIGANTALFTVVRAVLLEPFPFADQDRLVVLWERDLARNHPFVEVSYPNFRDWRARSAAFEALAAVPATNLPMALTGEGDPVRIESRPVSGNFFSLLGARPALGRMLEPADDRPGADLVVVLSHGLWQRQFAGDLGVIGRKLVLDGKPHLVVGVMPPDFRYPDGAELWTTIEPAQPEVIEMRQVGWLLVIGRLESGTTIDATRSAMSPIVQELARQHFKLDKQDVVIRPLVGEIVGDSKTALWLLSGLVGLVLLIACANVASLLVARTSTRQREFATRVALGATRAQLVRQVAGEVFPLALAGGLVGLALAAGAVRFLAVVEASGLPRADQIKVDASVLLFNLAISMIASFGCAVLPVLRATRRHAGLGPATAWDDARAGGGPGGRRVADALVAGQIALALVVAICATLVSRTFVNLQGEDFGFNPAGVVTADVQLSPSRSDSIQATRATQNEILQRIQGLPGVTSAAWIFLRPLWNTVGFDWPFQAEGQTPEEAARNPGTNFETATPAYFDAMGIRLLEGRIFDARDDDRVPGVVIVGETLARRMWPQGSAVGRRIKGPGLEAYSNQWLTVIGVVEDVRYREIEGARFDVYMPHAQASMNARHLVIRTSRDDPTSLAGDIRSAVHAIDPAAPVDDIRSMQSIVDHALAGRRLRAQLFSILAVLALTLAGVGVYSLLNYSVIQRRRELAVRAALGAAKGALVALVIRQGIVVALVGIAAGLAGAFAASTLTASLLVRLSPHDPMTFVAATAAVVVIALLACYVPAGRAARANPIDALKS